MIAAHDPDANDAEPDWPVLRGTRWTQDALLAVAHQIEAARRISRHDRPPASGRLDQAARHTFAIPGEQHRDMMRAPDFCDVRRRAVPANARLGGPPTQIIL